MPDTDLNHVALTGVLERDPITRCADHGTQQVSFTLRVGEAGPAGQACTLYVPCEAYGQAGEQAGERCVRHGRRGAARRRGCADRWEIEVDLLDRQARHEAHEPLRVGAAGQAAGAGRRRGGRMTRPTVPPAPVAATAVIPSHAGSGPLWPKPNTHDTSRKVIILQVGRGPVTTRVPLGDKTVTAIKSINGKITTACQKG